MNDLSRKLEELKIDRREDERSRGGLGRFVLVAGALLLVAFLVWWWNRDPVLAVRTVPARAVASAGGGATVLNASGYVTARRQATVSAKVTGKVVEVRIEEGMAVTEGQILARLDDSNVRAVLDLSTAELAAAMAALAETEVRLTEARRETERAQALLDKGVGTQQEFDRWEAERDALAARLERERHAVDVAEAAVAVQTQALEDTVIRAPFDGIVVSKDAQPGEMISPVSAGGGFTRTGIGTVVDMSSLEVEVDVNEAYIQRVRPDQQVIGTLDAYPGWRIPCRVIAIIPTADRQRATVQVRVGFEESDPRILPDMGIKVAFQGETAEGTVAVEGRPPVAIPRAAVRRAGDRTVVLVVEGEVVTERAVSLLPGTEGDEVQVIAGLSAGERVVIEGPPDLAEGQEVREVNP